MLDFSYTEDQKILEDTVKKFSKNEIIPISLEFENDVEGKLSEEIFEKAAKVGILGTLTPKEYGVAKIMKDVKIIQIYIGSNELIRSHAWQHL